MGKKKTVQISPDIVLNAFSGSEEALEQIKKAGCEALSDLKKAVQAWSFDHKTEEEKCHQALDRIKAGIDRGDKTIEEAIEF